MVVKKKKFGDEFMRRMRYLQKVLTFPGFLGVMIVITFFIAGLMVMIWDGLKLPDIFLVRAVIGLTIVFLILHFQVYHIVKGFKEYREEEKKIMDELPDSLLDAIPNETATTKEYNKTPKKL